jgi:hypoxanthine phosphoribosyltransferase
MPELIPAFKKDDISKMVTATSQKISSDYQNRKPVMIGVLNGAFLFLSDLIRNLKIPVKVDFIGVSSYGHGTSPSGSIHLTKEIHLNLQGEDVIIVEDIIDTGLTIRYIIDYVKKFKPKSIKICSFLDKIARRDAEVEIDYACFVVDKGFLVGYGLDYADDYRNLPDVYYLKL